MYYNPIETQNRVIKMYSELINQRNLEVAQFAFDNAQEKFDKPELPDYLIERKVKPYAHELATTGKCEALGLQKMKSQ